MSGMRGDREEDLEGGVGYLEGKRGRWSRGGVGYLEGKQPAPTDCINL